jgi:hypothetical protein
MTGQEETTADVLESVWINGHDHAELDEDCSPTKPCRNMKDVTFDGFAEPGDDLGAAWRAKLDREGKLSSSGVSVRDLILGQGE